jgi:nucleoside-diphosphate-sugar epimerase
MYETPECVAITGVTGFIGQPVLSALVESGNYVVAASRRNNVKEVSDNVSNVRVDIADKTSWKNLLIGRKPEKLIHLAWDYLYDFEDPRHYLELLPCHLSFIEWCVRNGINDITVAGTCYEYGLMEGKLSEEMPARPVVAYAIAKDAMRMALEHFSRIYPFTFKWARIFFVKGDEREEKGIFRFISESVDKGERVIPVSWCEQLRDYLHRNDVGRFMAELCLQNDIIGVVNCCSGKPVSMRRMVEDYVRKWPELELDYGKVAYRSFEPMAFWGSRARMDMVISAPQKCRQES